MQPKKITVYSSMEGTGNDSIAAEYEVVEIIDIDALIARFESVLES